VPHAVASTIASFDAEILAIARSTHDGILACFEIADMRSATLVQFGYTREYFWQAALRRYIGSPLRQLCAHGRP
jgi:hypothetical protein